MGFVALSFPIPHVPKLELKKCMSNEIHFLGRSESNDGNTVLDDVQHLSLLFPSTTSNGVSVPNMVGRGFFS
jgi:hypothetical protein